MTADLINPTSQLEAVNWGLEAVGFPPVGTLTGAIGRDASSALMWLSNSTRDLCRKGLWFSRRLLTLTPNDSKFLLLPSNVLSISAPSQEDLWEAGQTFTPSSKVDWLRLRPVMRQGKVFSVIQQSYEWTAPLTVAIREAIAFEDLPDEARQYAMVTAASGLNGGSLRSGDVDKRLQPLLTLTWDALVDAELENSNHRFL